MGGSAVLAESCFDFSCVLFFGSSGLGVTLELGPSLGVLASAFFSISVEHLMLNQLNWDSTYS